MSGGLHQQEAEEGAPRGAQEQVTPRSQAGSGWSGLSSGPVRQKERGSWGLGDTLGKGRR